MTPLRVIGSVLLVLLVLSCVDVTYAWYAAIETSEGTADWYSEFGVRGGALFSGNHDAPETGFTTSVHLPKLFPRPFGVAAGPEGGVIFVANWFLAATACGFLLLVRSRYLNRMTADGKEPPKG